MCRTHVITFRSFLCVSNILLHVSDLSHSMVEQLLVVVGVALVDNGCLRAEGVEGLEALADRETAKLVLGNVVFHELENGRIILATCNT